MIYSICAVTLLFSFSASALILSIISLGSLMLVGSVFFAILHLLFLFILPKYLYVVKYSLTTCEYSVNIIFVVKQNLFDYFIIIALRGGKSDLHEMYD